MEPRKWTELENDFLACNFETMTDEAIGIALGRSTKGTGLHRARMGLFRDYTQWSVDQERCIQDNFPSLTDAEIALAVGRSENAVKCKRLEMGMHRKFEPELLMKWSEGKVIRTAEDVVSDACDLDAFTIARMLEDRARDARTCLVALYANGPKRSGWATAEQRAAEKLRDIIRELNTATVGQRKVAAESISESLSEVA